MVSIKRLFIVALLFFSLVGSVFAIAYLQLNLDAKPRILPTYKLTNWQPKGIPNVGTINPVIPDLTTSNSMHYGINNTAQLMIATAPKQELAWVAEEQFYIPEGPTLDKNGHIYFSPYQAQEDVSLVSIDGDTGKRRWAIPAYGDTNGSGAILILNDIETDSQIIYHSTYSDTYAIKTSGEIIWHTKTGFKFDGKGINPHTWGVNYLPNMNALSVLSEDGKLALFDRETGKALLSDTLDLPGSPASMEYIDRPSDFISDRADKAGEKVFGEAPKGQGLFSTISMVIFGGGKEVTNFYASDPMSNRLYIAATAPDEIDGLKDNISKLGAIYAFDFEQQNNGSVKSIVAARYDFDGGTGSTPTVSNDGKFIFVSDENGNLITLDNTLKELWRINVGSQIAASISASADNNELYAVTAKNIHKVINFGDHGKIVWTTSFEMYPGFNTINALTAAITANGVAVSLGATPEFVGDTPLMITNGFGMLDKDTGDVISFVEGYEESIAATMIAPDGGFVIGSSPTRRLVAKGIFGDKIKPIKGGIARYKSTDNTLLARDAICMAHRYQIRSDNYNKNEHKVASEWDQKQISILREQASNALGRKLENSEVECTRLNQKL